MCLLYTWHPRQREQGLVFVIQQDGKYVFTIHKKSDVETFIRCRNTVSDNTNNDEQYNNIMQKIVLLFDVLDKDD